MNSREYIESGILELYVFGKLSDEEIAEVNQMAAQYPEVKEEITAIEKAVINLSYGIAPHLSATNFEKIRNQLLEKQKVIQMKPKNSLTQYLGWVAAAVFVLGMGIQFYKLNESNNVIDTLSVEKSNLQESVVDLELKNKTTNDVLTIVRDENNKVIPLGGQTVAPTAKAKIYWNQKTDEVYVDASGLPEPPEGKVYQIWSLKLQPTLTPTSIGLLADFKANDTKIFAVDKTSGAEAFGITLEPAGGSATPTMEQLYTLGKV